MRMRSGVVVLALVALGASACGQADQTAQTAPGGSVAPLTLPAPRGTVVEDKVGQSLGGRITPAATADYLSQVAAQTKQVNTGQFRLVTAVTGGTGHEGQTTTLTELSGAFDRDAGRSRVELDASGANAAGGSGLSALVTGPIGLIIIGSTGYLRMPDLFGTGAGTWMKTEDPDQGALAMIFDMFKVEDIAGFVESLKCAGTVTEVGTEEVDQVETTHYRADVDTAKLASCRQADPNAGQLLDNFGDATSGTVDVWVDANSLVRKLVNTADERALGSDLASTFPGGVSTLTMTLSGFGEPITIEPPPEDQVTEGIGGLGGLGDLGNLDELLGGG